LLLLKASLYLKHSTTVESLAQLQPLQSENLALLKSTRMGVAQLAYEPQLRTITANQPDRSSGDFGLETLVGPMQENIITQSRNTTYYYHHNKNSSK
jgi:hypothetical protein